MKKLIFTESRFIYADGASGGTPAGNEINAAPETTAAPTPNLPVAQPTAAETQKPATAPEAANPMPGMPETPKGLEIPVVTPEQLTKLKETTNESAKRTLAATEQKLDILSTVKVPDLSLLILA